MSVIPITCDNCGAKYKLPPTFKGSQAKCQKCGSVIDVAKQRATAGDDASPAAAAKPAAARPAAAAKPAVDRSKSRPAASSRKAAAAEPAADKPARASSSRSRRGKQDEDGDDSKRRGRDKKSNNTPMILGSVGLLAIVIVVAVVMMKKDDKSGTETAQGNSAANSAASSAASNAKPADANANKDADEGMKPADAGAPDAGTPEAGTQAAGTPDEMPKPDAKPAESKAPEAPAKTDAGTDPAPADEDPNAKKERWQKQKNPPQSMSEVQTPRELYGEVQWPASIDATKKAEILELVQDLDKTGGIRSIRAKASLVKEGYAGMFGLLECLIKLDYRQADDGAFGFEINKAIEDITGGLNAGHSAVQADENMHPAKALWNTKTVKAWMDTLAKWPDEAAFLANKVERAKKGS